MIDNLTWTTAQITIASIQSKTLHHLNTEVLRDYCISFTCLLSDLFDRIIVQVIVGTKAGPQLEILEDKIVIVVCSRFRQNLKFQSISISRYLVKCAP